MNIFIDKHHADLAYSFQLLFEKRLGHNVYFPIGMEWAEEKYWLINKPYNYDPDTAKQYLDLRDTFTPKDGTLPLNEIVASEKTFDGSPPITPYYIEDKHNNHLQRAITLGQFKNMEIDVIIASVPDHWKSFTELRNKYKPNAKIICHAGNHFLELDNALRDGTIQNLMASLSPFSTNVHSVFYHQEFDTDIFRYSPDSFTKRITSFINVLRLNGGSAYFYALKSIMPEFDFKSYGASCQDGVINTTKEMAKIMQESMFTFMVKSGADGYGHVLHNSFACGTPVIINYAEYKDKLGGKLLIPDETCLVANIGDDMQGVAEKIRNMPPHVYQWMRQRTQEVFKEQVNFEAEAEEIKLFLQSLN